MCIWIAPFEVRSSNWELSNFRTSNFAIRNKRMKRSNLTNANLFAAKRLTQISCVLKVPTWNFQLEQRNSLVPQTKERESVACTQPTQQPPSWAKKAIGNRAGDSPSGCCNGRFFRSSSFRPKWLLARLRLTLLHFPLSTLQSGAQRGKDSIARLHRRPAIKEHEPPE